MNESVTLVSWWSFILRSKGFCKFSLYIEYINVGEVNSNSEKKSLDLTLNVCQVFHVGFILSLALLFSDETLTQFPCLLKKNNDISFESKVSYYNESYGKRVIRCSTEIYRERERGRRVCSWKVFFHNCSFLSFFGENLEDSTPPQIWIKAT